MPSSDQLYKQKCVEFEELNENFIAYQGISLFLFDFRWSDKDNWRNLIKK